MLPKAKIFLTAIVLIAPLFYLQQLYHSQMYVRHKAKNSLHMAKKGQDKWHEFLTSNDKHFHKDNNVLSVMSSVYGFVTQKRLHSKHWNYHYNGGKSKHRPPRQAIIKPFYFLNDPVYQGKDFSFPSSKVSGLRSLHKQYKHIQDSIQQGALNISRLAAFNLKGTLEPYERWVAEEEPIDEVTEIADETLSQVNLVNFSTSSKELRVGSFVTIRIDIRTAQSVPLFRGGDEIRVWVKDQSQMASLAVDVEDLMNGSYIAHVPLLWMGESSIFVSLAYPREILRAILYIRTVMKAVRLNVAAFVSKSASEATLCSPFPINFGTSLKTGLCNLTQANQGRPWYCSRPVDARLTCNDWVYFRDLDFINPLPMTKGEKAWFDQIMNNTKHYLRIIQSSVIKLKVKNSDYKVLKPRPLCSRRPPRETWLEKSPRGMIHGMVWIPFGCRLENFNTSLLQQRLRDHTIYMIGDSNSRIWQEVLFKNHICHIDTSKVNEDTGRKRRWHDPTSCVNVHDNFEIKWVSHSLPFHTNPFHWVRRGRMNSVPTTLDRIAPVQNLVVLIHMYIHFTTHHASAYHDRIRAMRDGVARLLNRIPTAKVVIRGPHIAYKEWAAYYGGDAQAPLYRQILIDEFKDLYDKVIFLDFWDMSIAGENKEFHPSIFLTHQMMNVFFGYILE